MDSRGKSKLRGVLSFRKRKRISVLIPERLHKGDTIGIVSPSAAVTSAARPQLKKGIAFLRKWGFKVVLGKNHLKVLDGSAGTPEQRADDINTMFADPDVDAIICSQGGDTANTCLPLLNFDTMRQNPKIFLGISDITVLLNAFHSKTGLVTFHGNDVMWGFGRRHTAYDDEEFADRLIHAKAGAVKKNSIWRSVRRGSGEGRLIGGNLRCVLKLAGTEYQPDFSDSILFLESLAVNPDECSYMLSHLQQLGALDKVRGVLIGYIWSMQASSKRRQLTQMEDVLKRISKDHDFPIVKCDDFGHNCPNTTLPVGARARLTADGRYTGLEILEPCVL